jgi:hypothetical protein
MAEKRIFISYDYANDRNYRNLLLAWDKDEDLDFSFYNMTVHVSVDSNDAAAIKRVISARLGGSSHFLCLVGKLTHKSRWVTWEIGEALELNKRIVAVKIDTDNTSPWAFIGGGAKWASSFNFDAIKKAVDDA